MWKRLTLILCMLLCVLLAAGCAKKQGSEDPGDQTTTAAEPETAEIDVSSIRMEKDEYPVVDGSTATLPLSYALYRLATGASEEEAEAEIIHSKTTNSYYQLLNGSADLLIVYEASPETLADLKKQGADFLIEPVGKDALVFLKNSENPVESLTKEELRDIYAGKISNWKDVGGEDLPIVAFQRPAGSGSQTLMDQLIMRGTAMADAPVDRVISSMGMILEEVASYRNTADAIGYSVYYYTANMHEIDGLAYLGVDGVLPSTETIRSDQYGLVNPFYVVIRADEPEDSPARRLFQWLLSKEGQKLVEETGYVPSK